MLSDWSIYSTVSHMIGQSKKNEILPDLTPYRMLLDISALPKEKKIQLVI